MTHHWPIPASAGLIALALALGMWQRERAADAAAPAARRTRAVSAPAPAKTEETAAVETLAPENPAPQPVQPATAVPAPKAIPVAPAQPVQPVQPAQPAQPVQATPVQPAQPAQPVQPTKTVQAQPAQPVQPVQAQPAQPAAQPAAVSPRDKIIADFKTMVQNKLGLNPLDMAAGAWAFASDGARLEVQPPPNWTVTIYNANAQQPDVETDAFKKFLQLATGALGLDTSQPVVKHDNGKTYQKTTSKLGSVSIVRDPAAGNSCVIRPIGQSVVTPPAPKAPPDAPKTDPTKPTGQDF